MPGGGHKGRGFTLRDGREAEGGPRGTGGGHMTTGERLGRGARAVLTTTALAGVAGLNGVFLYVVFARRDLLERALGDPIAWVLMIEALAVTGLLAWAFARWRRNRLGWGWFVVLSLLGGLAFSIPIVLLMSDGREERRG